MPPRTGVIGDHDDMPVNRTEQAAVAGEALDGIQLIVSGHVHLFAASGFGAARPAQLIVGTGGDLRDGDRPDAQAETVTIAGLPAATFVVEQFGYLVLERAGTGWTGTLKDTGGGVLARCTLAGRDLACRPPG